MSTPPNDARRRHRWPRFRLSTILVLVGIAAWGMSIQPRWIEGVDSYRQITHEEYSRLSEKAFGQGTMRLSDAERPRLILALTGPPSFYIEEPGLNPKLKWPVLVLAAFLTWKLAWTIAARRNRWRALAVTR